MGLVMTAFPPCALQELYLVDYFYGAPRTSNRNHGYGARDIRRSLRERSRPRTDGRARGWLCGARAAAAYQAADGEG